MDPPPEQVPRPPSPVLRSPSCPVPNGKWTWRGECRVLEVRSPSCIYHQPSPPAVNYRNKYMESEWKTVIQILLQKSIIK